MLLKESWVSVTDNTNVRWARIFQLYKGFNRRYSAPTLFVKSSARVVEPPRLEYKGFRYKYNLKGDIVRLWLVRSVYGTTNYDQTVLKFRLNASLFIKKRQDLRSKFINGPVSRNLRRRKFLTVFNKIL